MTTIPPNFIPVDEYKSDPVLRNAVDYAAATANCKPDIESAEDLQKSQGDSLKDVMEMLNIGQCEYTEAGFKSQAQAKTIFGNVGASAEGAAKTSSGCEQLNVISNVMNQCTKQLNCMLNQVTSTTNTNVVTNQEVIFSVGDITGSDITIGNKSETNIKTVNVAQSSVQSAIGATIQQGLQNSLEQANKVSKEAFSDETGQKNMQQLLSNLQSVASNSTINESVASTTASIYNNQKITLYARNISNSKLNVTNDNTITLMAENYVYNALDQLFKSDSVQETLNKIVQTTETKSGSNYGIPLDVGNPSVWGTMVAVILLVGVASVYYYIYGPKSKKPKQSNRRRQQQQ